METGVLLMRFVILSLVASGLGFAQSMSGFLVDSKCFAAMERNVNPTDTMTNVDRDRNWEIRYCAPNSKSKTLALVDADGLRYKLDAAGNEKALELVRNTKEKKYFEVDVDGDVNGYTIEVESITEAK